MKNVLSISIIAIISLFMLQSCDSQKTVLDNVPDNKLDKTYTVKVGETFEIKMASNPTTGFKWEQTSKIKPRIIKEVDSKYIADDKSMSIVGKGGTQIFTFLAKKEGVLFIQYQYLKEGGKMDKEKYLKIEVQK